MTSFAAGPILGCIFFEMVAVIMAYRGIRHGILHRYATIGRPPRRLSPKAALFWGIFNVVLSIFFASVGVWFLFVTSKPLAR